MRHWSILYTLIITANCVCLWKKKTKYYDVHFFIINIKFKKVNQQLSEWRATHNSRLIEFFFISLSFSPFSFPVQTNLNVYLRHSNITFMCSDIGYGVDPVKRQGKLTFKNARGTGTREIGVKRRKKKKWKIGQSIWHLSDSSQNVF